MWLVTVQVERVVERQTQAKPQRSEPVAAVGGEEEARPTNEVRRHRVQPAALPQRLVHQADLALLEVADTPVDQPGRARARAEGDVGRLEHEDRQTALCRIASDPGTRDASPHDHEVEGRRGAEPVGWTQQIGSGTQLLGSPGGERLGGGAHDRRGCRQAAGGASGQGRSGRVRGVRGQGR